MQWDWRKIYDKILDWLIAYGPRIVLALVIFFIGLIFLRFINRLMKRGMEKKGINPSVRYFLYNFISLTLQVFLVVIAFQVAGFQLTIVSAIVAGFTVAAGLALSGTLQNFVNGLLILYLKPYKVGDNISTQGHDGTVTSIQLFYTVITMFDNKTMIIPNGQLSNSVLINLSRLGRRRLDIDLKFSYATDFNQLKDTIARSVSEMKEQLPNPELRVGISATETDKYIVTINIWTEAHGFHDMRLAVNEKLINDIKSAGIKFPGM